MRADAGTLHQFTIPQPTGVTNKRLSKLFLHGSFIAVICLQRFGVMIGSSYIFACTFLFLGLLAFSLLSGLGRINMRPLLWFVLVVTSFCASAFAAILSPTIPFSKLSLPALLLTNCVLCFGPTQSFETRYVFKVFAFYARLCAVSGIVQYFAQFAGIQWFSFSDMIPSLSPVLIEPAFNVSAPTHYGSEIFRANGFFLIEPSVFSQILVIGLVVDVIELRRYAWVPVYIVAYLTSYSGTGLAGLLVAVALLGILSPKRAAVAVVACAGVAVVVIAIYFIEPQLVAGILGRADELNQEGSSGYARYVAQGAAWKYFSQDWRMVIGYGPGTYERAYVFRQGSENAAIKLFAEYGLSGMLVFGVYFITSLWNRRHLLVTLLILVLFQLGGGYINLSPFVDLAALLCIWSRESPAAPRRGPSPERTAVGRSSTVVGT